jgi:hypothetical protein
MLMTEIEYLVVPNVTIHQVRLVTGKILESC